MFGSVSLYKVFLLSLKSMTGPTCQIELVPVKNRGEGKFGPHQQKVIIVRFSVRFSKSFLCLGFTDNL